MPAGAEERAVRAAVPGATIVVLRAGAAAADLPASLTNGPPVVIGLCGALRALPVGSAAIYASVVDDRGELELDAQRAAAMRASLPNAALVRAYTAANVVTRVAVRTAIAREFGADAVDMEGTHVARTLVARGVPFAMVRVVSDDASRDLPPIENAFDDSGTLQPLHLAFAFARDPRGAVRFVRDVTHALRTLGEVARAISLSS